MKTLIVISANGHRYNGPCAERNLRLIAIDPRSGSGLGALHAPNLEIPAAIVMEMPDSDHHEYTWIFDLITGMQFPIVCTGHPNERLGPLLHANGIADLLDTDDPRHILDYTETLLSPPTSKGRVAILDEPGAVTAILRAIIVRFGYTPVIAASQDAFLDIFKSGMVQFSLINIGAATFNVSAFIKKSYGRPEIRSVPLIAYKRQGDDLLINELTAGLGRLTKIILSSEELYSFLVDSLFRMEAGNILHQLTKSPYFKNMHDFVDSSFGQIYFAFKNDLFTLPESIHHDNYTDIKSRADLFQRTLTKVAGLSWLILKNEKVATCGWGV